MKPILSFVTEFSCPPCSVV